jgi:hypothetical protein
MRLASSCQQASQGNHELNINKDSGIAYLLFCGFLFPGSKNFGVFELDILEERTIMKIDPTDRHCGIRHTMVNQGCLRICRTVMRFLGLGSSSQPIKLHSGKDIKQRGVFMHK